jgi:DivIVA domain-containing protein
VLDMPLTPDEVASKRFQVVYGRGYDRSEVDQYLTIVADDYSAAIQKIAVAASGGITTEDDIASEMGELLRAAREAATRIKDKAGAEADRITSEADSDARKQLEQADKRRAELLGRAETEARQMVEDAEERARQIREASERQNSEVAARAHERFSSLLEHEKELRERIDVLDELVTEMRAQLELVEQIDLTDDEDSSAEEGQPIEGAVGQTDSEDPNEGIWNLQERLRQTGRHHSSQV